MRVSLPAVRDAAIKVFAALFVANMVVFATAAAVACRLEGWRRTESVSVLMGTHRAVEITELEKLRRDAAPGARGEGGSAEARSDLERRAGEMESYYRAQRDKLMLLAEEIKRREVEMKQARENLVVQREEAETEREAERTRLADENRQRALRIMATMDADQAGEYLGQLIVDGRLQEATQILRALPERRASEMVSAVFDAANRKMLMDALLTVEKSSAAQAR